MGISSIITFLSPSLENYWEEGAAPPPRHCSQAEVLSISVYF